VGPGIDGQQANQINNFNVGNGGSQGTLGRVLRSGKQKETAGNNSNNQHDNRSKSISSSASSNKSGSNKKAKNHRAVHNTSQETTARVAITTPAKMLTPLSSSAGTTDKKKLRASKDAKIIESSASHGGAVQVPTSSKDSSIESGAKATSSASHGGAVQVPTSSSKDSSIESDAKTTSSSSHDGAALALTLVNATLVSTTTDGGAVPLVHLFNQSTPNQK
jgi:hypothetical protein